ncbi:uncharacterized protein LOC113510907 [Galleria mellonella]|uniref:Uncharacterized protein LOC113510907 n=1 Tax=Galleria mellonella TaxID=7137 RepID=A0ABM3MB92_GALME|nr:uncharacterized protein LOC113510907 [Galleria mellonella]
MLETIFCCLLNTIFLGTFNLYNGLAQGPGQWSVKEVGSCDVQYPSNLYLSQATVNTTADQYDGVMNLPYGIDNTFSMTLYYTKLDADRPDTRALSQSFGQFLYRFTVNTDRGQCRLAAETHPFYFPVPRNNYKFDDYVYKYQDYHLPTVGIYGTYKVNAYLVRGQQIHGCSLLTVQFK